MKEAAIYKLNAFKDPLSNFLFSTWQNFFAILLFIFFLQVAVGLISGTLIEIDINLLPQEKVALLKDNILFVSNIKYIPFSSTYLMIISLFFLVKRFLSYIPQAFQELFTKGIFKEKKGSTRENVLIDYNKSLQEFENLINSKRMYVPAFLFYFLVIIFFVVHITPIQDLDIVTWDNFYFFPFNWIVITIVGPLMWFVVGILIWKMYCVASFMRKLALQYEYDLDPYNRDGFGGFKPLGQLWVNLALVITPFLLSHILGFLFHRYFELSYPLWQMSIDSVIIISYIIIIIILLIYPMKKYHDIVRGEKLEHIRRYNERNTELWKVVKGPLLSGENEDSVKASWEQLECSLQEIRAVKEIPSWPFTLSERIGVLLIALVPWIIEVMHYFRQSAP